MASGEVLGVMLEKFIVPSRPIWDMVVKGVFNRRRVWRAIDNCWWAIWGS